MMTVTTNPAPMTMPTRPSQTHAPAPAAAGSIDPIKLLNKHKWLLGGAAVAGAALGVALHFVFLKVYPVWRPVAMFNILPAQTSMDFAQSQIQSNDLELTRFMSSQVKLMTDDVVLEKVVSHPDLMSERADKQMLVRWSSQFYKTDPETGLRAFDHGAALDDLKDKLAARAIPTTSYVQMSFSWREREPATEVLRLCCNVYQQLLRDQTENRTNRSTKSLRETLDRIDKEIIEWKDRRSTLIRDNKVGSIDSQSNDTLLELQGVNDELLQRLQSLQQVQKDLGGYRDLEAQTGTRVYPDELKQEAERDPQVMEAAARVRATETHEQALINRNIPPEHRARRDVRAEVDAAKSQLEQVRERVAEKMFRGRIDMLERGERSLSAQINDLQQKKSELSVKLTELSRSRAQINDFDRAIESLQQTKTRVNAELQNMLGVSELETARRVVLVTEARPPIKLTFPRLKFMIPGGVMLMLLLTGGTILTRELIDQRVKGPSDINLIPRTRLLGWVPDAAEDPSGAGSVETAFRDRSRGVLAESYRQIRSLLSKRLQQAGHKSIVIMSGMPASGATSVVSNLALAFASADQRVLIIDANFRRPAIHRVFGQPEAPGLADVLARKLDLESAIVSGGTPNLDLLPVGSRDDRVVERLATDVMSEVLAAVRSRYDLVLIDVAPAVVAGDGVSIAHRVDASVLVVKAFGEKRGMVSRIKNELSDSKSEFLGVVVNAVRSSAGGYMKGNIRAATEYEKV